MSARIPGWIQQARDQWTNTGAQRPSFAIEPGPGQASVWDYPRPPAIRPDTRLVEVSTPAGPLARTQRAIRVLETSHPPSFYLPPDDIVNGALVVVAGGSHCEWKGPAEYLGLASVPRSEPVGWRYPRPYEEFESWANWVSFYPGRVQCSIDGESVRPQAGGFYGGWITDDVVGPFKGDPGTSGW